MAYFETIYDITTGETTTRNYTPEEVAEIEAAQAEAAAELAAYEAHKLARQAVLEKLGLTADEIALLGL